MIRPPFRRLDFFRGDCASKRSQMRNRNNPEYQRKTIFYFGTTYRSTCRRGDEQI